MSRLRVAPIVEGHGEVSAVPELLRRIWYEVLGGEFIDVLKPIRQPRSKLLRKRPDARVCRPHGEFILRATQLASAKLGVDPDESVPGLVLLLLDANSDCPRDLAPEILRILEETAPIRKTAAVLPVVEYETWFVASAESLEEYLSVLPTDRISNPESLKLGKAWIEDRFRGAKYSETIDQVRLTAKMDLKLCRQRSRSFDKLCRELERLLHAPASPK